MNEKLRRAIEAAEAGEKRVAYRLLIDVLKSEPGREDTERAWLWLATVLDDVDRKRQSLEMALKANPNSEQARSRLAELNSMQRKRTPAGTSKERSTAARAPERAVIPERASKRREKRRGSPLTWFILVTLTLLFLFGETSQDGQTRSDVAPTPLPAKASSTRALQAQMDEHLADYNYTSQKVEVVRVEVDGRYLKVWVRRSGKPNMADYYGQLGLIHGTVARNEPDINALTTIDVDTGNGFRIAMSDLMSYWNDRIDFEAFRARWQYFDG